MTRLTRTLAIVGALTMVLAAAGVASGARPDRAQSEQERILAYWTPERMANAIPRQMVIDGPRNPQAKPPWAGGGGGGDDGGSGDGSVTGAPWNGGGTVKQTTGKVYFTLSGTNYVCSGSVVQDSISGYSMVLTAGHCVYHDGNNQFASNWVFYPNYEDDAGSLSFNCSSRCFTAAGLVTTQEWRDSDFDHDYAFAIIAPRTDGTLLESDGTQAIAFNRLRGEPAYAFGYPHAKPYNGKDLIYCKGTVKDDPFGGTTQGMNCDMTGGSSGGPWFDDFNEATGTGILYGLNSYKYRSDKSTMYGPYFGSGTQATYNAANSWTGGNILVDAAP